MRQAWLVIPVLLMSVAAEPLLARVLLPSDEPLGTESPTPNLGISPVETPSSPATSPAAAQPAVAPIAPATSPAEAGGLDKVNLDVLNNLPYDDIRKQLPDQLKGLSNNEIKGMLSDSMSQKKDSLDQYFITDPKTGAKRVDLSKIAKPSTGVGGSVGIRPGGTVGTAPLTEDEIMAAKFLANGKIIPKKVTNQYTETAKQKEAEAHKKYEKPPTFLSDIEITPASGSLFQGSLLIGVMSDYSWGEKDIKRIKTALGYTREQIPQNCQMRLKIQVKTSDGLDRYHGYIFTGEQKNVKLSGDVQSFEIRPMAVCNPPSTLPQNGAVIFKHGDKHGIVMEAGSCEVPPAPKPDQQLKPTSAGVRYLGDSKFSCAFR